MVLVGDHHAVATLELEHELECVDRVEAESGLEQGEIIGDPLAGHDISYHTITV